MKPLTLFALALAAMAQPAFGQTQPAAAEPRGTNQSPGSAEPPPVAHDRAGDRYFDPAAMARAAMEASPRYSQLRIDLAEVQFRQGHQGYRWEGEAWTGDVNRLMLRSKGEGGFGEGLESAELQALYSRALDPWWNLQAGVRQDIGTGAASAAERTYATIAIEGLAPYRFDLLAAAYLSNKGQLTARLEGSFDERLTRRLILQPRVEFHFSAQASPAQKLGAGLGNAEAGLRLRYEISRQFAPYIGFSYSVAAGKTGDYRRAAGQSAQQRSIVIGIKSWL